MRGRPVEFPLRLIYKARGKRQGEDSLLPPFYHNRRFRGMAFTYREKVSVNIIIIGASILFFPMFLAYFAYEVRDLRWDGHFAIDSAAIAGLILGATTLAMLRWK